MTPAESGGAPAAPPAGIDSAGAVPAQGRNYTWLHKTAAVLFVAFCLMMGLFLVIFPWTEDWDVNYFAALAPWRQYWENMYVRGAISGLGVMNLYISLVEVFRLRRFAKR
ncbi:MAG: hypothetical protein LAP87_03715 [Acidobacteriia bacterium]|nr:hypothetical protein [Terriglobia bacterium]